MQVKSIAESSKRSILQYFRPSLSYYLSFRSLFFVFFTQVLLYNRDENKIFFQKREFPVKKEETPYTSLQNATDLNILGQT